MPSRYEDFFGTKKKKDTKGNLKRNNYGSDDLGTDEEPADDKVFNNQRMY